MKSETSGPMSKRFTDTDKWKDDWFLGLSPNQKLFWGYLCDHCDHAGVWRVSKKAAELLLEVSIDFDEFLSVAGDRIKVLEGGYWYLTKFCQFQYGTWNRANSAHRGALKILIARGLEAPSTQADSPLDGAKDKDKVKDKDEDKTNKDSFDEFWNLWPNKTGKKPAQDKWIRLSREEQEAALKAVPVHISARAKMQAAGKFVPEWRHPKTWITQRGWEDQFELSKEVVAVPGDICRAKGHQPGKIIGPRNHCKVCSTYLGFAEAA